jgi:hypothetical protein
MPPRTYRRQLERRLREVEDAKKVINDIDAAWLWEIQRRREESADAHGFKQSRIGGGGGSSDDTVTERAALNDRKTIDPIGKTADEIIALVDTATTALRKIERRYSVIIHAHDARIGRESSLQGQCSACGKDVTGCGEDRIKAGYGPCCWMAWSRYRDDCRAAGIEPSHVVFRQWRAAAVPTT